MEVGVKEWAQNKNSVSVYYGPLAFSLKIDERYEKSGGTEKWPAWEIYPESDWNYGLSLNETKPEASFEVVKKGWPESNMPFTLDHAPIQIKASARKIPEWQLNDNGLVEELQQSPAKATRPLEQVTLVPMGAARIRISAFPTVSTAEDAVEWE
jgi:hypothetical protein